MTDKGDQMPASQAELAEKAVRMTEKGAEQLHPENEPTVDAGHVPTPRPDQPPSGALDAEGHRPVLERSRKVR